MNLVRRVKYALLCEYHPATDPKLDGHCFYVCCVLSLPGKVPSLGDVSWMRWRFQAKWRGDDMATFVAEHEGLDPSEYEQSHLRAGWGGLPESRAFAK